MGIKMSEGLRADSGVSTEVNWAMPDEVQTALEQGLAESSNPFRLPQRTEKYGQLDLIVETQRLQTLGRFVAEQEFAIPTL